MRYLSEIDADGKRHCECESCGRRWHTHWPIEAIRHECDPRSATIGPGPGTELEIIFRNAGAPNGCNVCKEWRDKMNAWGVEGCREHRAEIIQRLQQAAYETWITDSMRMGFALMLEPWFRMADPLGSCVDEAIRRSSVDAEGRGGG